MQRTIPSDHFDGRAFHNLDPLARTRSLSDVWKWYRARRPARWPTWIANGAPHPVPDATPGRLSLTWIGHSSFLIRLGPTTLLTDPVFALHAGPFGRFGPRRVRAPGLSLAALPRVDVVLQSHNHYDHLDPYAHRHLARAHAPQVMTALGNRSYLPALARPRTTDLDWWETYEVSPGLRITAVPAQHFSARTPWDRDRALWCGFVVEGDGRRIYFAGDSGYGAHFAEIGRRFPAIDLALLPIGAYEPRWFMGPVHVDPAQAVQAHLDLGARTSVAMHFGTFQLTDEGIDAPVEELRSELDRRGITREQFLVPTTGGTITLE
jgi:L-ascorbate metabolism protein UlaG (beta-lactamase superfamily)